MLFTTLIGGLTLITMGKYGWYVWPSYGVALAVIVGLSVMVWRSYAAWKKRLAVIESETASGDEQ